MSETKFEAPAGIYACACLGPMYNEPYCSCQMKRHGLDPSPERLAASKVTEKDLQGLSAFFERNRLSAAGDTAKTSVAAG